MTEQEIKRIESLNAQIQNFRECYSSDKIYADRNGDVSAENLLAFMIENPHFQSIADNISKLRKEQK